MKKVMLLFVCVLVSSLAAQEVPKRYPLPALAPHPLRSARRVHNGRLMEAASQSKGMFAEVGIRSDI